MTIFQSRKLGGAAVCAAALTFFLGTAGLNAADPPNPRSLITSQQIATYQAIMSEPAVMLSVKAQNERRGGISQDDIDALDKKWRAEADAELQPLMAATLTSPASNYLMEIQARSLGLYAALFVTDKNGLNVGQSVATSDYWQGDEAKFQKTAGVGPGAIFIDEPEYYDDVDIWVVQVNFPLVENDEVIGAATVEVNLTEMARRAGAAY